MVCGGALSTFFVDVVSKDVGADLRRHDDEGYRSGVGTSGHCCTPSPTLPRYAGEGVCGPDASLLRVDIGIGI
jgi:hypothetical protein